MSNTQTLVNTATVVTEQQQKIINESWGIDPDWHIFFYVVWGIMYVCSIIPSVFGSVAILNAKAWIYWYLLINAVFDFLDLEKHPADEKYIWTLSHWLTFSLRRVLVEYAISFIVPYTQFIPIVNWILNLIPIGLSYVNAFVL